jgi:ABC-type antimicrobial peptide transport system permease subunit
MIRVPRAMAALALAGGLGGLLVAAVGLYGLLAFRVRQRRKELGVRLALGADGRRLAGEILKLALRQLLPALGVGLLLAWLLAPVLGVVLLGLNPRSPSTYLGVAMAFTAVGITAALIPARRAAAVNPAEVLRGE